MLRWEKDVNGYNGNWMGGYIGFDDGCPLYKVGEDGEGWYYEYLPDADGMDGYETAEEAMAAADEEYSISESMYADQMEDLEPLSWEDLEDIHWDEIAHERMEIIKGLF